MNRPDLIPARPEDEDHWHQRFSDKRLRGEWFELTPPELTEIWGGTELVEWQHEKTEIENYILDIAREMANERTA